MTKSNNKAYDITNVLDSVDMGFRKTALFRLRFWININSKASHSSEAFWNRSTDHRVICMIAINASLGQVRVELSVGPNKRDIVSYEDYMIYHNFNECKSKGVAKMVDKDYIVQPNEIIEIRFNV